MGVRGRGGVEAWASGRVGRGDWTREQRKQSEDSGRRRGEGRLAINAVAEEACEAAVQRKNSRGRILHPLVSFFLHLTQITLRLLYNSNFDFCLLFLC